MKKTYYLFLPLQDAAVKMKVQQTQKKMVKKRL